MNQTVYEQLKLNPRKKLVYVRLFSKQAKNELNSNPTLGLIIKRAKLKYNNMYEQAREH